MTSPPCPTVRQVAGRWGVARWLGCPGQLAIPETALAGGVLRLHRDPISWLRAASAEPWRRLDTWGPPAVCWIGPGACPWREVLEGVERVVCDDAAHAGELHRGLTRRIPRPTPPQIQYLTQGGTP